MIKLILNTLILEVHLQKNKGGINKYQNITVNGKTISIEISAPMTRDEIKKYIMKMQQLCGIDYHEVKKNT